MKEKLPVITDHLCDDCRDHFEKLQGILAEMGIRYVRRSAPRPRPRLLHEDRVRDPPSLARRAERALRGRALRRPRGGLRGAADPRRRILGGDGAPHGGPSRFVRRRAAASGERTSSWSCSTNRRLTAPFRCASPGSFGAQGRSVLVDLSGAEPQEAAQGGFRRSCPARRARRPLRDRTRRGGAQEHENGRAASGPKPALSPRRSRVNWSGRMDERSIDHFGAAWKRTHRCGEVSARDEGTAIVLAGWVKRVRELGYLTFLDLWDRTGIVQLVTERDAGGSPSALPIASRGGRHRLRRHGAEAPEGHGESRT